MYKNICIQVSVEILTFGKYLGVEIVGTEYIYLNILEATKCFFKVYPILSVALGENHSCYYTFCHSTEYEVLLLLLSFIFP